MMEFGVDRHELVLIIVLRQKKRPLKHRISAIWIANSGPGYCQTKLVQFLAAIFQHFIMLVTKPVFYDLMICIKSLKSWFDKSVRIILTKSPFNGKLINHASNKLLLLRWAHFPSVRKRNWKLIQSNKGRYLVWVNIYIIFTVIAKKAFKLFSFSHFVNLKFYGRL